jgi:hypothetical protein
MTELASSSTLLLLVACSLLYGSLNVDTVDSFEDDEGKYPSIGLVCLCPETRSASLSNDESLSI